MSAIDTSDPANARYCGEWLHNRASFESAGVSLQDYIGSRRVDDGLEVLVDPVALASAQAGGSVNDAQLPDDPRFAAEYAAQPGYAKAGLSLTQYAATRRNDEAGIELATY